MLRNIGHLFVIALVFSLLSILLISYSGGRAAIGKKSKSSYQPQKPTIARGIHPVLFQNMLLGGALNGKIVNDEKMVKHVKGGEIYLCYTKYAADGKAKGSTPGTGSPVLIDLKSNRRKALPDVAICGSWNALPRIPKKMKQLTKEDKRAVASFLQSKGLKRPTIRVTGYISVDLDGDGNMEHLIFATTPTVGYIEGPLGWTKVKADDYSLAMVTGRVTGMRFSTLIDGVFFPKVSGLSVAVEFSFGGVYDADGDGRMELLVITRSSEEISSATFYRFSAGKFTKSEMQCIWGAGAG